ncbi:MAG: cardiolipin synthase ClsB [Sulfuricella sp.]|nr:cardiolipin synthase ClsB [Sulfuricella sp.]
MRTAKRACTLTPGNRITLLESGDQYFPALETALDAARREIFLESYIFDYDQTGRRITAALMRAAQRGVAVHLLIDGFGSRTLAKGVIRQLRQAGVAVLIFRPELARFRLRRHRLRRLHRKLAVMDGAVAFVGGINIIDDMDTPHQIPPRYDYAVRVEGPLAAEVREAAQRLWSRIAWTQLRLPRRHGAAQPLPPAPAEEEGAVCAALVIRDNLRHRRAIEDAYLAAIAAAQHEVVIANAYFLPGLRFRHALIDAARRGVRVVLLLQGRVEYLLLHYASRALYGVLLDAGVEIHEYHRSFLHAKVAVVDGHWATVGSSNIDPFSLLLAREANVVVESEEFAAELRTSLERALQTGSRQVSPAQWHRQSWHRRLRVWLSYGLVRLLMGMAGYAGE